MNRLSTEIAGPAMYKKYREDRDGRWNMTQRRLWQQIIGTVRLMCIVLIAMHSAFGISLAGEKPQSIYTIQISSHRDMEGAEREFERLTKRIPEDRRDSLRIEKIGDYYSLRLGNFNDRSSAEELSRLIKPDISSHVVIKAYFIQKRIVKMYGRPDISGGAETGEGPSPELLSKEASMQGEGLQKQGVISDMTKVNEKILEHKAQEHPGLKLKGKISDLCMACHKGLKKALDDKYVHYLFKEGKCIVCHNSHVSKEKGLMVEELDALCMGCHEGIKALVDNTMVHGALRENNCSKCHFAHSGDNPGLLVKKEKTLCLDCHEDLNSQMNKPYICGPFKKGECSACHESHASPVDDLLVSPPKTLCTKCHAPKCKVGDVSIADRVKDTACTSCHSGHSSADKGLLGPFGHKVFLDKICEECHEPISSGGAIPTKIEGKDLCLSCHIKSTSRYEYVYDDVHVKDAQNPCVVCHDYHASTQKNLTKKESTLCLKCHQSTERRTEAMMDSFKSSSCEPVRERRCFECHLPGHSSRPLSFRADDIPLCARCHASQHKISHPLGPDVKDPRTGQPVTCNSCHSMHSANADYMLTHDRTRALCIQCHTTK